MREPIAFLLLGLFGLAFDGQNQVIAAQRSKTNENAARKWYEGGTLHKKGALDWQSADAGDKLATCADFVAAAWDKKLFKQNLQYSIASIDDMKPYAQKLVTFLDSATKKDSDVIKNRQLFTNASVSEIASIGMVMMGWTK